MEKLKKIPIIGYLIRLFVGIAKLPKHLNYLYSEQGRLLHELDLKQKEIDIVKTQQKKLEITRYKDLGEIGNKLEIIRGIQGEVEQQQDNMKDKIANLELWNLDRMDDIRDVANRIVDFEQLQMDDEYLENLNRLLSTHPTIWGNKDRLHISKLAAVDSCTFNTNSGEISIGSYTFAGSGVSILAGSHDKRLKGLLRRDVEMKEGCDISVGHGVWLGSNCTILGPAQIGDNAVIASGAVVIPGTVIPPNSVYGGIPARLIQNISIADEEDVNTEAIQDAVLREGGVLFVQGWTEKKIVLINGKKYIGHYKIDREAVIYSSSIPLKLFYFFEQEGKKQLEVQIDDNDKVEYDLSQEGILLINSEVVANNGIHKIKIICSASEKCFYKV
ncbi:acyltransferase [Eubacterium sp. MSJ-33]|uniref:acyltransferase n=1 Tax=Eubacterium sp. MSJ-33 TaxID=2841528 RepID=UPI00272C4602|nr:acyltransferase [Eubacterium sp. MSJ-33]